MAAVVVAVVPRHETLHIRATRTASDRRDGKVMRVAMTVAAVLVTQALACPSLSATNLSAVADHSTRIGVPVAVGMVAAAVVVQAAVMVVVLQVI